MNYAKIDIDFDVYKQLTIRRETPQATENDVLRDLLGLPPSSKELMTNSPTNSDRRPDGLQIFGHHKGEDFVATFYTDDKTVLYNGKKYRSLSGAASDITGYQTNGWLFWKRKDEQTKKMIAIDPENNKQ